MPSLDDAIGGVTADPLDAAIDGVDQGNARLRTSLYGAVKQNPDEAARALQLSRKTGLPAPLVQRNLPQVEQRTTLDDLDAAIDKSSALAGKMSDPGFAALGHDDVGTLAEIEKRARKYGEIKASRGPQASFSSIVAGQLGVLPNTFDRIREGLRLEFADTFGLDEMAADAQKKRARTDFRESLTTPEFDSTLGRWVYGGAANVQRVAPSIAAGIATRNPYVGLAGMGLQVQPETYGKYRARGATPGEAALGSGVETGIEIGTELLPMGFLVDKFGKAGAKDFIAGYLGRELPTELVAEISQGAVDTAIANPDKTWGEFAAELPDTIGQTVVSTLMMSGGLTAVNEAARRLAPQQGQADTAQQDADALAEAAQLAAASKLRTRDPQTFQEFAEAVDPGAELYLDARTLQQSGVDVAALAQASPAVAAQLQEALATGGDLVIPKAEYLTAIAGTDLDPVLTPHLRTSEDAMSADEAQRFYQDHATLFQEEATKAFEAQATETAFQTSAKEVEAKLFDSLKQTGRFTDDVNKAYATLGSGVFTALATRLGVTPTEAFSRYPLKMAVDRITGGQRMEQEQTAAEAAGFDTSTEWLHGTTAKNFRAFKPGKGGVNELGPGVYFTKQEMYAKTWARGENGRVIRTYLKRGDLFDYGKPVDYLALARRLKAHNAALSTDESMTAPNEALWRTWLNESDKELAGHLKSFAPKGDLNTWLDRAGYIGAVDANSQIPDQVVVFDPKNIRSVDAKFDPAKADSANIMAQSPKPNLAQRVMQAVTNALGVAQAQPEAPVDNGVAPLDMGQFFQGQGNRAEISFAKDITSQPSVITLFKNADLSSFLHEMGHFQLEVLAHIASQPNAPAEIVQDLDAVFKWFAPEMTLEQWQAMSLEEKRPYHEQFARGFEAYLFEGKAPSTELTGLFARFRAWLINVYKSVKALNVEISDDIRGVFDRLLATDEAIKQAEAARGFAPLFPDDAEMQAMGAQATQDAVDELQRRSLRDMRWLSNARGRILKQMQRDARAKRQAVEDEVKAEVRAMPVYAAQRFLRYGEMAEADLTNAQRRVMDTAAGMPTKLELAALKEMYGEEANAPWRYLPTGKAGLAATEGLPPDLVAEMFGFTSGDHLVREILAAEPEAELVEGMTDQRVLERYGDIASPDALARAVDEAIHNEARARFVATELKAVSQAAGPVRAITAAAKAFAETLVARKKVKDIKPRQHAAAETRAAKAAERAMAEGDTLTAASEKRNQLVQNYATRVSYDALAEVDKAVKYLRKFDSEGTRKSLDVDYLDQIDALLERFDLRASVSNKDAAKRASLIAWLESQRELGFEPDIPPELVSEAMRKPYRELTLEELRGLIDTVKQIEHLGRLKQKLLTAADERAFDAVVATIRDSIAANAKGTRDLRTRNTPGAMLADAGNRFLAMHRKMASVSREMDGFADGGPMWDYFIRSMNAAGDRETTHRAEATRKLYDLVKPLLAQGKMGGKGQHFETLGASFNREERIAIALNLGNAGNMQRLLDGEGWTMARLKPLLDTITPEEADFVQAVWDFFESYRPEIAAKERRIYGKEPAWVEPQPVVLGGKTLKGGYYPIKYDTARSGRAEAFADAETAKQQMRGAFTSATTRRSFTKARAEEVTGRPLVYSFAGLYQGTNEVIHDLTWHEWLIDANRLLRAIDGPMRLHYGAETVGLFKAAIQDIAAGDVPAQNVFERGLNHVRTGATIAGLGWNLMTSLLQPIGLTQSMVRIGPGWVTKGLGQWIKAPLATIEEIKGKSAMMADRARTMQREINEIQNQVQGAKLDPVRSTFFVLIQKMQMAADVPTWLGAYEKHIAAGENETRAIALADQAVLDAQGGGQMKDLSQIQRGHPALKLFTNFYSFFNVAYNLGVEKTKQKISDPKLYPSLALDYLLLYTLPAAIVTVMREAILGGGDDEDELVDKIIADQISYVLGLMVGTREVTAAVQKVAGVEQFKGSYGGPAGLRLFQELDNLGQQVGQGELDMALFKAANNAAGIVFHYPSGQVNRTAEGVAAMLEGKTENPAALVVGPPRE